MPENIKENVLGKETSPSSIMQIALGFRASKTLLAAADLGIFTHLARKSMNAEELRKATGIHERSALDFFDALVALRILERQHGVYKNSLEADIFLDKAKDSYIGGLLEVANQHIYKQWDALTDALKTGKMQSELEQEHKDLFDRIYTDPKKLEQFLQSMTGLSLHVADTIASKFNWKKYKTFADIGCAQGASPRMIATMHPHLKGIGFDLPVVGPFFKQYMTKHGLADRVTFQSGSFFDEPLPKADVIVMGHILHDWNLDIKKMLITKAYDALPTGGAIIVYEMLIDDDRSQNVAGLLMSLNMLIATQGGFDYTGADCQKWLKEAGFKETYTEHLIGPHSMVVGLK